MKRYIYFMVSLLVVSLTACKDDYLETSPESAESTSTILASTDNAKLAINGICKAMSTQYLEKQGMNGEGTIIAWYGDYPGNDTQKCALTGWSSIINSNFHLNTSSIYLYYPWYYYYKLIGNANAIVCNIDNAEGTEAERAFLKAQALTFRAYSFFRLAEFYAHRWSDEQGNTDGIVLRIDQSTGDLPLSTLAETYEQIYADLDEAIALFQQSGLDRDDDEFYKPNLNVAYAVYARAALTREDWANAAKYAALARQGYALMSASEYNDGFHTPNSEWIWGVYEASDQTLYYYSLYAYLSSNGSSSVCRNYPFAISKELIDQIPSSDARRWLYLVPSDKELSECNSAGRSTKTLYKRAFADYADRMYSTSRVYAYMQFKFLADFLPGGGSFSIFRTSEMYYIEAEADCHLNKYSEAQQLLYAVNSRFDSELTQSTKTGNDLLEEVKLYRRFDLWGEGHDWFDYKRWGQSIERTALGKGGSFHSDFAVTIKPEDANNWTWALPERETDYNKAIGLSDE